MGSIVERKRKDGTPAFLAQISIMRKGVVHRENETFDRRPAAAAWLKKREAELAKPGVIGKKESRDPTLKDAITKYIGESDKAMGKTKAQVLRTIQNEYDIAALPCSEVDSQAIVAFAKELRERAQPQTVGNYLSHLGAVFAVARPAWGYELNQQQLKDANVVAKKLGLTSKSRERDRRPTLAELDLIMTHFIKARVNRPTMLPMAHVVAFAIFSTRRQEEITRIEWQDLDEAHRRVLVRDMKNPGDKIGNNVWVDLPEPALRIIKAMPRAGKVIFPYTTDAIGANFTRANVTLGINTEGMPDDEKLKFHDLRHDGISRLFELGMNIPHAAAVSGHRSWTSLKRYTHVRQSGDKYADWPWLEIVTKKLDSKRRAA